MADLENSEKESFLKEESGSQNVTTLASNLVPIEAAAGPLASLKNNRRNQPDPFTLFMTPMIDDLEKAVAESMQKIDEIEAEFLKDTGIAKREDKSLAHLPREIREPQSLNLIMRNLEKLITNVDTKEEDDSVSASAADESSSIRSNETKKINNDDENEKLNFNSLNRVSCLAQSLSSYLITYDKCKGEHMRNVTCKIYEDVNLWISRLFRFNSSSVIFHDYDSDGLVRIIHMLINLKFPDYISQGYLAFQQKQPSIYISASSKYASKREFLELISIQLGLPFTSIRIVPVYKDLDDSMDKIDHDAFVSLLDDDVAAGFSPLILVANAGSQAVGQCDDVELLNKVCYKYHAWLHLEGIFLSSLVLRSVPTAVQPVLSGDSITLNLATWLGIPSLSFVTIYRNVPNTAVYFQAFNTAINTLNKSLPYWCLLQLMGHNGVLQRIKYATDVSNFVRGLIVNHKPYIKEIRFKTILKKETKTTAHSVKGLIAKAINFLTFVDLDNPIVIFKCDQSYIQQRLAIFSDILDKSENVENSMAEKTVNLKEEFVKIIHEEFSFSHYKENNKSSSNESPPPMNKEVLEYTDTLTTWLCDLFNSMNPKIEFDLIDIQNEGTCIRFSPLEHINLLGSDENDFEAFASNLEDIMKILNASIKSKSTFEYDIKEFENLLPVHVPKWAGVGAVRYIPKKINEEYKHLISYQQHKLKNKEEKNDEDEKSLVVVDDDKNETYDKLIDEINSLNEKLATKLQANDSAFTHETAPDGIVAIKFGMITKVDDVKKLAFIVQNGGNELEESTRFIAMMSDLIREGIQKANEDLKRENEQKFQEQGLFRQIPLVGGLVNWWSSSPASTTSNTVTGRAFNLNSGKIFSTELTHKYKMQIEETATITTTTTTTTTTTNYVENDKTDEQATENKKESELN